MKSFKLASFLAFRMLKASDNGRISKPIVRIAMWGVAIGIALMILSLAIVKGFQSEVRQKVIGFGGHFQIVSNGDNAAQESVPLLYDKLLIEDLKKIPGIKNISVYAQKPAIVESKAGLSGVIAKGIEEQYDTTFLHSVLTQGRVMKLTYEADTLPESEIVLSEYIANRLALKLGQKMSLYIVNSEDDIQQQNFTLVGTYKTELEEYDEKFIFVHLAYLQQFGGWGLQGQIIVDTASVPLLTFISPVGFGNEGEFEQHWLDGTSAKDPILYLGMADTTFGLVTTAPFQIADTTYVHLKFPPHGENEYVTPRWTYSNLRGSEVNYIGGYEVQVENYEALERVRDPLWEAIPYDLFVIPLTDRNPEIFAWLEMLDVNVVIIVVLMAVLSIVNMTSALLILILERQSFIGTLKSMGLPNPILLRVFLWHAAHIIGKGVIIGNILGIGIALFQKYTGVFKLDPANYYVSEIPILMNPMEIIILNALTLCVCVLAMILPSLYVSTFRPAESIRKN